MKSAKGLGSFSTGPLSVVQLAGESREVTRLIIAKRLICCQILVAGVLGALGWGFALFVSYSRAPPVVLVLAGGFCLSFYACVYGGWWWLL